MVLITLLSFLLCVYNSVSAEEFAPTVRIFSSKEEMGKYCAQAMANTIDVNNRARKKTVLGLCTGQSPLLTYHYFRKIFHSSDLDLLRVTTFNLDEYIGLNDQDPHSFHGYMYDHLFHDLIRSRHNLRGIRRGNIHIPSGYFYDWHKMSPAKRHHQLRKKANEYEALVQNFGPIDLQLLGIGQNGHIGFDEPGSKLEGKTQVVRLTKQTRETNALFFDGDFEKVPTHAITMGIGTILTAKEIIVIALGAHKAEAVFRAIKGPICEECPASALRLHPRVTFVLDHEAAQKLISKETL